MMGRRAGGEADRPVTPTPFDDKIEWTYYLLWHHEGRQTRHRAAMADPDDVRWYGLFGVAGCFYSDLLNP